MIRKFFTIQTSLAMKYWKKRLGYFFLLKNKTVANIIWPADGANDLHKTRETAEMRFDRIK